MSRPRILAGSAKGRPLEVPRRGTRPSPARLREALFDLIRFRSDGPFLDLYSGSGAIGLEAASRGYPTTCVELAAPAAAVLRRNARALGLDVEVVRGDALELAAARPGRYGIVFAAPPYPLDLNAIFQRVLDGGAAAPEGWYVFQHPDRFVPGLVREGRELEPDTRVYGSNALTLIPT